MQDGLFKQYRGVFDLEEETKEEKIDTDSFKKGPNTFALADAFGSKSAKNAWVEYIRLRNTGIEAESLHATLVGKARDMLSSQKAEAEELGIHPFVYKKAKADFKNWTKKELEKFYDDLVLAYHRARMGEVDLSLAVEKILLAL